MVFYNIRVGTFLIKYMPFSDEDESYPIVDKDKNKLEYVKGTRTNGYYVNPITKEKTEQTFMLINDSVKEKFERTKETDKYKEVEETEVNDLVNPKQYIVECDKLLEELKNSGKALKFGIHFGGKSKPYLAIIFVNKLYNLLEMWISKGKKINQYESYITGLQDKQKLKEVNLTISGIDKAKVEDLIEL